MSNPYFMEEKSEIQRDQDIFPGSHSHEGTNLDKILEKGFLILVLFWTGKFFAVGA